MLFNLGKTTDLEGHLELERECVHQVIPAQDGGVRGVTVIVVGNGHGNTSSNQLLHFT